MWADSDYKDLWWLTAGAKPWFDSRGDFFDATERDLTSLRVEL